ncbi:hypothetical protein Trydic_g2681 [Trypoxylus dichotomus]
MSSPKYVEQSLVSVCERHLHHFAPCGVTLDSFLGHRNSQHPDIKFTMEVEKDGVIPFLDVLVKRKPNARLGHSVYRKPTHTDRYLHADPAIIRRKS